MSALWVNADADAPTRSMNGGPATASRKGSRLAVRRRPTATSTFGVSRRESHDASGFYARFTGPEVSEDSEVCPTKDIDRIVCGDARRMDEVPDASVALVVTSPPYFAGKEYEEALGVGDVPATYLDYLAMLEDVFAECVRTLEPGGRLAVNVANLGRKPYRSLSADVTGILQDRLRLLLRGEVVWQKARGATGSCAWGTFQRPGNPVLRDLTERVVIASKGRFDRAVAPRARQSQGLPAEATISRDEFMEATTDVWELPAESATRVGHPAPFPVELPERLIHLYTYRGDLVLDPFMGSGTTAVAALRTGRHFAGYDTDPAYVEAAAARVEREWARLAAGPPALRDRPVSLWPGRRTTASEPDLRAAAVSEGTAAKDLAELMLKECGFSDIRGDVKLPEGVDVSFAAVDGAGREWLFEVAGGFTTNRPGLRRAEVLWRTLGKAAVLAQARRQSPLVVLTTDLPTPGTPADAALRAVWGRGRPIADVVELLSDAAPDALRGHAQGRVARARRRGGR